MEKFMIRKFRRPHKVHFVLYDSNCEKFKCSCKLWNSIGVPCGHIFCVLKELDIEHILSRLVLKRWCKDARSSIAGLSGDPEDLDRTKRVKACLGMCVATSQAFDSYETAIETIARLRREFEMGNENIADPRIVRSKGAPRGSTKANNGRRCKRYLGFGHDQRNRHAYEGPPEGEYVDGEDPEEEGVDERRSGSRRASKVAKGS